MTYTNHHPHIVVRHSYRETRRSVILLSLIAIVTVFFTVGCDNTSHLKRTITQKALEYEVHPTEYNLTDMAHSYGELLIAQKGDTIRPGFFSDYGVALALLGKNSEANRMFNNEVLLYPNASRYVRQLKLMLVPEYLSDTVSDTSTIYIIELDTQASDVNMDATGKDSIQLAREQQRLLREQQKAERQREQQAAADERNLIKSIRAREKEQRERERAAEKEAKEQAKKEAERLKKEAEKAKEQAKKESEKRKKEEAKAKEEAKKEAARQKEQERKDQQEQRAKEREERARQHEAERRARQQATDDENEEQ